MPGSVVKETGLPRLTLATVISYFCMSTHHRGVPVRQVFLIPFPLAFSQKTKHSKKKKGSYLREGKGFNPIKQSKETSEIVRLFSNPLF